MHTFTHNNDYYKWTRPSSIHWMFLVCQTSLYLNFAYQIPSYVIICPSFVKLPEFSAIFFFFNNIMYIMFCNILAYIFHQFSLNFHSSSFIVQNNVEIQSPWLIQESNHTLCNTSRFIMFLWLIFFTHQYTYKKFMCVSVRLICMYNNAYLYISSTHRFTVRVWEAGKAARQFYIIPNWIFFFITSNALC